MPVVSDDVRALDILVSGSQPQEINEQIQNKLGLNTDDVRAWQISKQSDPEMADRIQAKVLDKVRSFKELEKGDALKATIAGGAQGVTFGFSDELIAAAKTGWEKVTKGGDTKQIYEKKVKQERAELKRLEDKYPIQFIAAELAGAVAVPIPGARVAGAGRIARIGAKGARLAAEAALMSAGKSEADIMSKQGLEEVAKGTAMGLGGGLLLGKAGKKTAELLKKGEQPVKKAAQVVSNVLFDLPPAYSEKLLNRRTAEKILNPKSSEDIVSSIMDITKDMGEHARALSLKASEALSEKKNIDLKKVYERMADMPAAKTAQRSTLAAARQAKDVDTQAIQDLAERADNGFISERELKRFVQDIDKEIPWNKNDWVLKDQLLGDIRSLISNDILKQNAKYRNAMKPVDEIMRSLSDVSKSFSLRRKGYGVEPSDATYSKVRNFFNVAGEAKKPVTEKALKRAEEMMTSKGKKYSILEDIEIGQIASRTEGGMAAGSKHVLQGLAAGTLFGAPLWGAVIGGVKDRYGRAIGKAALPKMIGTINFSDRMVRKSLEKINPELLDHLLRTTGRVSGVEQGISAAQKPPLLP